MSGQLLAHILDPWCVAWGKGGREVWPSPELGTVGIWIQPGGLSVGSPSATSLPSLSMTRTLKP